VRVVRLVDDAHRPLADDLDHGVLADARAGLGLGAHSSSSLIACARLVFMRLKERASAETSSLPAAGKSPASSLPRLTSSARRDRRTTRRTTMNRSMRFRNAKTRKKIPAIDETNIQKALSARRMGSAMGTLTICAPMTSWSFQPKPLAGPYF